MLRLFFMYFVFACFFVQPVWSNAESPGKESLGLVVSQAWARATPPGAKTGVVYMTLHNHGAMDLRLTALETPNATNAQLHMTTFDEKGVMSMSHQAELLLRVGETVELSPSGMHVMLMGLNGALREGENVSLKLVFGDDVIAQVIDVPIKRRAPSLHKNHDHAQ